MGEVGALCYGLCWARPQPEGRGIDGWGRCEAEFAPEAHPPLVEKPCSYDLEAAG